MAVNQRFSCRTSASFSRRDDPIGRVVAEEIVKEDDMLNRIEEGGLRSHASTRWIGDRNARVEVSQRHYECSLGEGVERQA